MKISTDIKFVLSNLSISELKALIELVRSGLNQNIFFKEEAKELASNLEEFLLQNNLTCEGCGELKQELLSNQLCPLKKKNTCLCEKCFKARKNYTNEKT